MEVVFLPLIIFQRRFPKVTCLITEWQPHSSFYLELSTATKHSGKTGLLLLHCKYTQNCTSNISPSKIVVEWNEPLKVATFIYIPEALPSLWCVTSHTWSHTYVQLTLSWRGFCRQWSSSFQGWDRSGSEWKTPEQRGNKSTGQYTQQFIKKHS